jgi:hypothetical protein
MVFTALIWAALRFGPTQWSRPSRARAAPRRARRSAAGWRASCTTTGPSSLRCSADGVADQPGQRRLQRHLGAGVLASSGRRACHELAAEGRWGRPHQRGRGAPAADTERHLEELERAGIDGFDRSLIPRVEWL